MRLRTFLFSRSNLKPGFVSLFSSILLFKFIQAFYFVYLTGCSHPENKIGNFAFASGDTFSYTGAMENYISKGTYFFFNGKENIYAGRLPHYSIPYFLFRQFLSPENSYDLLVILQLLIECLAGVYLVKLYLRITNDKIGAWGLILLFLASSNLTVFSIYASPESFSCSLLIFFLYWYYSYTEGKSKKDLVFSGCFLSLAITLKPYLILLFLPIGIHFLFEEYESSIMKIKKSLWKSLLIASPLVFLLLPWTIRNYSIYKKMVPLQINTTAGYNYTDAELSYRKFVMAWGGDIIFWEKTSAGCYFMPHREIPCEFKMPSYAFTNKYGLAEVEQVRTTFIILQDKYSDSLNVQVAKAFDRLTEIYKKGKPFQFYFLAPLRLTIKFLVHSGSYYLPVHTSNPCYRSFQLILKLSQSGIYWISLLFGIPGVFLLGIRIKNIFFPFLPVFIIIFFPVVLHAAEARYFRTVEPILYLGVAYLFYSVQKRITTKKFMSPKA